MKNTDYNKFSFWGILISIVSLASYSLILFIFPAGGFSNLNASVLGNNDGWMDISVDSTNNNIIESDGSELANPFVDLNSSDPNAEFLIDLYYKGIISGDEFGNVRPNDSINRAELVKILVDAADVDLVLASENCFLDVGDFDSDWFVPYVCSAKNAGLVKGYGDSDLFNPSFSVEHAEGVLMTMRAFGMDMENLNSLSDADILANEAAESSDSDIDDNVDIDVDELVSTNNENVDEDFIFIDIAEEDWFYDVAYAALHYGLVSSDTSNFNANNILTRGDVARIVVKGLEFEGK